MKNHLLPGTRYLLILLAIIFTPPLSAQPVNPCINDTQPPTLTCPNNLTVSLDPGACVATLNSNLSPSASDNCSLGLRISQTAGPRPERSLWAWGLDVSGQLGNGSITGDQTSPMQSGSDTDWVMVSAGRAHSLAIKSDGSLWAWGDDFTGQVGNGDPTVNESSPVQIGTDTDWAMVSGGYFHSLALKSDGSLWAWGEDSFGQLGNGEPKHNESSPVKIGTDTDWAMVSAGGNHSLALKSDGSLWAWGDNFNGQIANENIFLLQASPLQIGTDTDWSMIAAGNDHSLAIKSDGSLWAWGSDFRGQVGNGSITGDQTSPVQIHIDTDWTMIAAGNDHSLALKSDGSLWAWGYNSSGQVGNGSGVDESSPVDIGSDTDWAMVAAGGAHSLALKSDGSLWAWGWNADGQIGIGSYSNQTSPVKIGSDTDWAMVAGGVYHSLAIRSSFSLSQGTHSLSYTATDAAGNTATCAFTITVNGTPDLSQQGCNNCGEIRSTICQFDPAPDLTTLVMANATYQQSASLSWYANNNGSKGAPLHTAPAVNANQNGNAYYWVEQVINGCPSEAIRVRVRVKKLFVPDFNLPAIGCGGSAQIDLAAWVSDSKNKATAYTFYDVDPESNPGATPVGTASATQGVVNFGQYVLVNVTNGSQTYWVQSTVPNGCGGIASSTLNAPAQTASLNAIPNLTVNSGDPVNIAFSGQNTTHIIWLDHATFNNPNIGIMGSLGLGNLAFTASNSTGTAQTATIRVISYNGNCAGTFQDFTITVNSGPPNRQAKNSLQLAASWLANHDVSLNWDINSDFDLIRFEVEKMNVEGELEAISEVAWEGNGAYQFIDQSEMGNSNSYRLKLILTDGRIVWSETLVVSAHELTLQARRFSLYPNPSTDKFQLKALFTLEEAYAWQLTDMIGKVVKSGELQQQEITILTSHMASGVYYLTIISADGKQEVHKLIHQ